MRHFLRSAGGPVLAVAVSLLFCEVLLRFLPSPIQYPAVQEFDDPRSLLGVELVPSSVQHFRGGCFQTTVSTNSLGWRDRERTVERIAGKTRIAVLGDSYMEGTHVEDAETMARQLENLLGPDKVEVLNFGLSSIGTVQEEILYDRVVRQYRPDIVLVAFYSNDVQNSDPILDGGGSSSRLTFRADDGSLVHTRRAGLLFGLRRWLRTHSALFRLLKMSYGHARRLLAPAPSSPDAPAGLPAGQAGLPPSFGVYGKPRSPDWERAWKAVDRALARLQRGMDPGTRLIVFDVPEILQLSHEPRALVRREYGADPGAEFDPRYPHDRLQAIARAYGIRMIDLLGVFQAERDKRALPYPYFSFPCDGHWNPLGHRTAAQAVATALQTVLHEQTK